MKLSVDVSELGVGHLSSPSAHLCTRYTWAIAVAEGGYSLLFYRSQDVGCTHAKILQH